MRFSIVYDDNGTILSAAEGDATGRPAQGPDEKVADSDIPDPHGAGLQEAIERGLVDMDATKIGPRTAQKEH